jgi:3-phenylpropionate/trans-cinnamate dioxygenase ferredoxin reductase subunit
MAHAPGAQAPQAVVVVGAGPTAAAAAQTLRDEGFTGRVTLVGEDPERPYERPPLSKGFLQGAEERDTVFVHPAQWYADNDVHLVTGTRVESIDRDARRVLLASGEELAYDALLLATGSTPRRLTVPGADLEGVQYLRTLQDSQELRAALDRGPRVVVVGGGWIGLETAATARGRGLDVTLLEQGPLPLLRVLGPRVAQLFAALHRAHGVDVRTGVEVLGIESQDGRHVSGVRVRQAGGGSVPVETVVPADLVIVGVGITPVAELAERAGLAVDNGVVVDEHLRTADPAILAAGDVANAPHPVLGRRLRVEHQANAHRQGAVAARSILGHDAVDDRLPYFFTDQYDLGMEYVGYAEPAQEASDDVVLRGDPVSGEYIVFWLDEGRVAAGMNVNVWDVNDQIEALIMRGGVADRARLADPDIPLPEV